MTSARILSALLVLGPVPIASLGAQSDQPIRDNSFLLEEAYNQEWGTVQTINNFALGEGGSWVYALTQEWAVGGVHNQFSFTLPVGHDEGTGIGDVFLNYRYQAIGDASAPIALAPRLSLLLPTGSVKDGRGAGGLGVQLALPVTWQATPFLTFVGNTGLGWHPSEKNAADQTAATVGYYFGGSMIWSPLTRLNLLFETLWLREEDVGQAGEPVANRSLVINPGVAFAFNGRGGWQLVPGVSYTIGLGPSSGDDAVFFYLSYETAFRRSR